MSEEKKRLIESVKRMKKLQEEMKKAVGKTVSEEEEESEK